MVSFLFAFHNFYDMIKENNVFKDKDSFCFLHYFPVANANEGSAAGA